MKKLAVLSVNAWKKYSVDEDVFLAVGEYLEAVDEEID
jgi:hypothetical protein